MLLFVIPAALLLPKPVRSDHTTTASLEGYTLRESMRTGMFWVLTAAVSTISMLVTALALGVDLADGFAQPTLWLATIPLAVLVAGILVRPPRAIDSDTVGVEP